MCNLQKLNLAGNEIEHIPAWFAKKLKSLRVLNLKGNKISSLQDVSKLKPLQDLTSLILIDNPVVALPHYLQFIIFHLRSLESLEGQPVTTQDRQEAFERFSLGKMILRKLANRQRTLNLREEGTYLWKFCRRIGSGQTVQRAKAFIARPEDLSSIPRIHLVKGKSKHLQVVLLHVLSGPCQVCIPTHSQ